MAGIYIHIPFCKTRCIYCDFYSTTRSDLRQRYIHALCRELADRKDYLNGETIDTIYLGGGTPSQLMEEDFRQIFATIYQHYTVNDNPEITLEANPDDLNPSYVKMLSSLPFNRISMGIQTFDENTLRLLKRRHTAQTAVDAIKICRDGGFQNISIDLIYGLPGETVERWEKDLKTALSLNVEHISAYHLTYEKGTSIYSMLQKKQIKEVDEELSVRFFSLLIETLKKEGYEHYEISNFCKPGMYSRHNTSYWKGIPYLGCGPSAHSFDGFTREWNIASIKEYMEGVESGKRCYETEERDKATAYNEFIITTIRTMWGASLSRLKNEFGTELWEYCNQMAAPYLATHKLEIHEDSLRLTQEGIFISDSIMSDLLFIEE